MMPRQIFTIRALSILGLSLLPLGTSLPTLAAGDPCEQAFASSPYTSEEVYVAQSWMAHRFEQHPSPFSMRFKRAKARSGDPENLGEDVISFGSGPDAFSPLVNFPLARRIHLVDSLIGWGRGTGDVLRELVARLKSIHPEARIRLQDPGFLRFVPREVQALAEPAWVGAPSDESLDFDILRSEYPGRDEVLRRGPSLPLRFEISWKQEGLGPVTREILVHLMDFNDAADLAHLDHHLGPARLGGILIEGAPFPQRIRAYIERLEVNGIALLETYSNDAAQLGLIRDLELEPEFQVQLIHMETYQQHGNPLAIEQKLYLVRRVLP